MLQPSTCVIMVRLYCKPQLVKGCNSAQLTWIRRWQSKEVRYNCPTFCCKIACWINTFCKPSHLKRSQHVHALAVTNKCLSWYIEKRPKWLMTECLILPVNCLSHFLMKHMEKLILHQEYLRTLKCESFNEKTTFHSCKNKNLSSQKGLPTSTHFESKVCQNYRWLYNLSSIK